MRRNGGRPRADLDRATHVQLGGADAGGHGGIDAGRLRVILAVEADTLEEAADRGLHAVDTGGLLLRPIPLLVQSAADLVSETAHPEPLHLDLIGITEIAGQLGVSRQRAGKLAENPDFPAPVVH